MIIKKKLWASAPVVPWGIGTCRIQIVGSFGLFQNKEYLFVGLNTKCVK